jgi:LysM repeat protein
MSRFGQAERIPLMLSIRKDVQMGLVIGAIVLSVVGVYVVLSAIAGASAKHVAGAELVTDPNASKLAASVTPVQPNTPVVAPSQQKPSTPVAPPTQQQVAVAPPVVAEPSDPAPPTRGVDPWSNIDFNSPKPQLVSNNNQVGAQADPQPAKPTAPAQPGTAQQYAIEPGDTFSSIAQKFYGDARHFDLLLKANPAVNPGRMKPGTMITIPPMPAKAVNTTEDRADVSVAPIDPTKQYQVQPGDSLHKISTRLYGTSTKWNAIYQLNQKLLGPDATKLKPGMILTLPEAPTASTVSAR